MLGRPSRWSTLPRTKPEQRLTIPFDLPKTYKKEFPIQNPAVVQGESALLTSSQSYSTHQVTASSAWSRLVVKRTPLLD